MTENRASSASVLFGLTLVEIRFTTVAGQPEWVEECCPYRECLAGTPLEADEVVQLEGENDQGEAVWWTARLTGARCPNLSRYGNHTLRLGCQRGPWQALQAVEAFFNGSWLQGNAEDPSFLRSLAELRPGEGVNLREEGHAVRVGDCVSLWSGMSYLGAELPQAQIAWEDWSELVKLNLVFLDLKAAVEAFVRNAQRETKLPGDAALPQYQAAHGFLCAERWQ
ncbi:hypothetical protein [Deinococcus hopiensis]|uniref:Uncharacterized protein n=1 Tax=Deinococcus hopiensis KR-140 TaxID=695939 RepID=A0A1W1UQF2_9DEIO|nr:hypothetical protein [Deinococcus hopiensis]SMB83332.1 hypothetical protein SAMN00790413_04362 [Deinococcus hopiensis KR-140]